MYVIMPNRHTVGQQNDDKISSLKKLSMKLFTIALHKKIQYFYVNSLALKKASALEFLRKIILKYLVTRLYQNL